MSIVLISQKKSLSQWQNALSEALPDISIQCWPKIARPETVKMALCWDIDNEVLSQFPSLSVVASMGAGVDHLIDQVAQLSGVKLVRMVDGELSQAVFEYVLSAISYVARDIGLYKAFQQQGMWRPKQHRMFNQMSVGVLGLGEIGRHVAGELTKLGFQVRGWSRSKKHIDDVDCYDEAELASFLSALDVLVCCLPLTAQTRNILDSALFSQLSRGALVVNVGRGEHLVEEDLISALSSGQLGAAVLDVTRVEPLPSESPLWELEPVLITPHIAGLTNITRVCEQIVVNYRAIENNTPLVNQVRIEQGY